MPHQPINYNDLRTHLQTRFGQLSSTSENFINQSAKLNSSSSNFSPNDTLTMGNHHSSQATLSTGQTTNFQVVHIHVPSLWVGMGALLAILVGVGITLVIWRKCRQIRQGRRTVIPQYIPMTTFQPSIQGPPQPSQPNQPTSEQQTMNQPANAPAQASWGI